MAKINRYHFRKVNKLWSCTLYFQDKEVHLIEAKASTWRLAMWSAKLKLIEAVYKDNESLRDLITEVAIKAIKEED